MSNASTSTSLEAQLEAGTKIYQKLQKDFGVSVESRQRLDAQKGENESVKKEFATLIPSNTVYKLVGSVLLKQDQAEAKANVDNRLELIGSEIKRVEKQLTEFETKMEQKKMELVHLQAQLQQRQQAQTGTTEGGSGNRMAIQSAGV